MTIVREIHGNIFESDCQTITVPVNTRGIMGAGLALAFSNKFPGLGDAYRKACVADVFTKEGIFVYDVHRSKKILCFPSKRHWRYPSDIRWIETGLKILSETYKEYGIESLAIPPVGCGYGGLNFNDVHSLMHKYLGKIDLPIVIYLP